MKVKLCDIEIYAGTQARQSIDNETVTEYAERMMEGDVFPPVVLFNDGNVYYVGDGFHRVLGSERNGFVDIDADVRKGTQQDALWYALAANKTNGRRMTKGDLRHAIALALKTWPDKTQQAIADQVGCSQATVHRVFEDVIHLNNISLPETRTDSIGRQQPTSKPHKQETQQEELPDETGEENYQDEETQDEKPKRMKSKPPCMGLQFARLAIMDLEKIEKNDTERDEAFNMVRSWIDEN